MFNGVEGMPRQIEQKVKNALKWLSDKPRTTASLRSSSWSASTSNLKSNRSSNAAIGFDYDLFTKAAARAGPREPRVRPPTARRSRSPRTAASAAPASTSAASRRSCSPTPRISARISRSRAATAGRRASRASTGRRCSRTGPRDRAPERRVRARAGQGRRRDPSRQGARSRPAHGGSRGRKITANTSWWPPVPGRCCRRFPASSTPSARTRPSRSSGCRAARSWSAPATSRSSSLRSSTAWAWRPPSPTAASGCCAASTPSSARASPRRWRRRASHLLRLRAGRDPQKAGHRNRIHRRQPAPPTS